MAQKLETIAAIALTFLMLPSAYADHGTSYRFMITAAFIQFEGYDDQPNIPVDIDGDGMPDLWGFLEIDAYRVKSSPVGRDYEVVQYIAVIEYVPGMDEVTPDNPVYVPLLTLTDSSLAYGLLTNVVAPTLLVEPAELDVSVRGKVAAVQIPETLTECPSGTFVLTRNTPAVHEALRVYQPTDGFVVTVFAQEMLATVESGAGSPRAGHVWIAQSGILTIVSVT